MKKLSFVSFKFYFRILGSTIKIQQLKAVYKPFYRSCLVTACPLSESTLKLLVRAGKIKNATTVKSLPLTCRKIC